MPFNDRKQAGHELGIAILRQHPEWRKAEDLIVVALPRGGVPVGVEVARTLDLPLRLLVVRKIGMPDNPELAAGAIADPDTLWWNEELIRSLGADPTRLELAVRRERKELERRVKLLAPASDIQSIRNKSVILVDDGIATGATIRAAILASEKAGCNRIHVAVPVASRGSIQEITRELGRRMPLGEITALETPDDFASVSEWFEDFPQLTDLQVLESIQAPRTPALKKLHGRIALGPPAGGDLHTLLEWPEKPRSLIVFAHGSLSSSQSPRNLKVAQAFHAAGHATFLFDLLNEEEFAHRAHVFDIPFLTRRLLQGAEHAQNLLKKHLPHDTAPIPLVLYGASTGAAAAINAARNLEAETLAVISRGGRPDLADPAALNQGRTPTLLLVGGLDSGVIELNRDALERMKQARRCELAIIDGATHLFEEYGKLEEVASRTTDFIQKELERSSRKVA